MSSRMMLMNSVLALMLVGQAGAEHAIRLPSDAAQPVIEMWYVDMATGAQPEVIVYAGGKVWIRVGEGAIWGQLTGPEFETLLRSLWDGDQISELSTDTISREIATEAERLGLTSQVIGATETVLRIRTQEKLMQVRAPSVGILATRFPQAQSLQRLASAQRRLENLRAVTMAGGQDSARQLATLAQQKLLAEHGESVTVTSENLTMVRSLPDGTRFCQFVVPSEQFAGRNSHVVSLFESPGDSPRISVLPNGLRN